MDGPFYRFMVGHEIPIRCLADLEHFVDISLMVCSSNLGCKGDCNMDKFRSLLKIKFDEVSAFNKKNRHQKRCVYITMIDLYTNAIIVR